MSPNLDIQRPVSKAQFWNDAWQRGMLRSMTSEQYDKVEKYGKLDGKVVLEIGCGCMFGEWHTKAFEKSAKYVALDIAESVLAAVLSQREAILRNSSMYLHAQKKWAVASSRSMLEVIGDAASLPFRDSTFDRIISLDTIGLEGKDTQNAIIEAARVLKPNGSLTFNLGHSDDWRKASQWSACENGILAPGKGVVVFSCNEQQMTNIVSNAKLEVRALNFIYNENGKDKHAMLVDAVKR